MAAIHKAPQCRPQMDAVMKQINAEGGRGNQIDYSAVFYPALQEASEQKNRNDSEQEKESLLSVLPEAVAVFLPELKQIQPEYSAAVNHKENKKQEQAGQCYAFRAGQRKHLRVAMKPNIAGNTIQIAEPQQMAYFKRFAEEQGDDAPAGRHQEEKAAILLLAQRDEKSV